MSGELSMINTKTDSKEHNDIIWMEKFVFPYGKCWVMGLSEGLTTVHYMKILIEFTDLNKGFTMKVTDWSQWSFVPYIESFWGHKVDYENGTDPEFGIFNMQLQEHVMDSTRTPKPNVQIMELKRSMTPFMRVSHKRMGRSLMST